MPRAPPSWFAYQVALPSNNSRETYKLVRGRQTHQTNSLEARKKADAQGVVQALFLLMC